MLSTEDGFDLRGRLRAIAVNALLIHGDRDVIHSPNLARETAEGIPHARLITYEGRNHTGSIRDPRSLPTPSRSSVDAGALLVGWRFRGPVCGIRGTTR